MEERVLGWVYNDEYYINETGEICERKTKYRQEVSGLSPWFENFCTSCGYTTPKIAFCTNFFAKTYFGNLVGENENDLMRMVEENGRGRRKDKEEKERAKKEREKHSDMFITVDTKDVDFYDAGFSVFVLLNTKYSYPQQLSFLKKNKNVLIKYIAKKLSEHGRGKAKKASDLLPFCYVSDIVLKRTNEVRVTYEIKSGERR